MRPSVPLRKALSDPQLLGGVLAGDSWRSWRCLMIAAMGEALSPAERAIFTSLTGRLRESLQRVEELVAVVGRRGGKSRAMSVLACYIAGLCRHDLVRGETGVLLCIAPDQRQAGIVLGYAEAAFEQSPILRQLIAGRSTDTLTLTNGINIEVRASSFRRLRGPTYVAVIADEAAFYCSDEFSANTDSEILNSVRPGLATTGGPLIIASSPYAKRGVLHDVYRKHYGPAGDPLILVAQGASRAFNPSLPQSVVDRALERDHAAASAEYLANFRSDIESFVSREAIEACVAVGVRERPPVSDARYFAFCDPSGGSADSFTLVVGHKQDSVAILDAIREVKPPFSPSAVVAEFAALLKSYRLSTVIGDKYAGVWPVEQFAKVDIKYEQSARPKSELYQALLPLINSGTVDLLDHPRAIAQLCSLERRTARGGRDSIDHAPGAHDDVANAIAGLAVHLGGTLAYDLDTDWICGRNDEDAGLVPSRGLDLAEKREFAMMQMRAYIWSGGGTRPPWSY